MLAALGKLIQLQKLHQQAELATTMCANHNLSWDDFSGYIKLVTNGINPTVGFIDGHFLSWSTRYQYT
jgi:hypothetical protein